MERMGLRALVRRVRTEDRGFTLLEMLASTTIFVFVIGGVLGLLDATAHQAPKDQERAHAIREAQVGVHRMVRELRQTTRVLSASANAIEVEVRDSYEAGGATKHVRYSCGEENPSECARYEVPVGQPISGASPTTVIARVLNSDQPAASTRTVFAYPDGTLASPLAVNVRIEVPAKGERSKGHPHSVILEDGFTVRSGSG